MPDKPVHGRGSPINPAGRFERIRLDPDPDAAGEDIEDPKPSTQFYDDASESLLTENDSPDIHYRFGLNPYRGCEHGCAYCYARPYHEYLGWSAGMDFESRIMVKRRAPELLRRELGRPRWTPQVVGMSGVTDCYQPAERRFRLTRGCLEVFAEYRNPVTVITKNHLVTRDRDLLSELARSSCVYVLISITTLDSELAGRLEPRASRPDHRLRAIRELTEAGVPVGVMTAPIIPGLNDHEIPAILQAAADAGARRAGYTVLRLPWGVKDVFSAWLAAHEPGKAARVLDRIRKVRGGALNDSDWKVRMKGAGPLADQVRALFTVSARRAGLTVGSIKLSTEHFRRPGGSQIELALPGG